MQKLILNVGFVLGLLLFVGCASAPVAPKVEGGIFTVGDPVFATPTKEISDPVQMKAVAERLTNKLREIQGAGLAANQIGEPVKAFVVEVRKTELFPNRPESPLLVFINPKIIKKFGKTIEDWEGCFSVPGLVGFVPRYESITVKFKDGNGVDKTETYTGYVARVIQHEMDHLEGFTYAKRMKQPEKLMTFDNFKKHHLKK